MVMFLASPCVCVQNQSSVHSLLSDLVSEGQRTVQEQSNALQLIETDIGQLLQHTTDALANITGLSNWR